jgi:MarR family 2-MHQ and catechol resistance regulon transcriptional repressor
MKTAKKTKTAEAPRAGAPVVADVPTATALRLFVVMSRAFAAVQRHAEESIAESGLTGTEFGILEALHHRGPLLLGELQRKILVSSGGITFLVDRLEKRGLVQRLLCDHDRRARYADLTDEGRVLIARIFPRNAEAIRRAMSGLGLADQRAATVLLRTLGTEAAALAPAGGSQEG